MWDEIEDWDEENDLNDEDMVKMDTINARSEDNANKPIVLSNAANLVQRNLKMPYINMSRYNVGGRRAFFSKTLCAGPNLTDMFEKCLQVSTLCC